MKNQPPVHLVELWTNT